MFAQKGVNGRAAWRAVNFPEDRMDADKAQLDGPDFSLGMKLSALSDGTMLTGHVNDQAVVLVRRGDELFAWLACARR